MCRFPSVFQRTGRSPPSNCNIDRSLVNRTRDRPPLGDARRCGERVVSAGHPRRKKNTRSPLSGPHYSLSRANSLEITVESDVSFSSPVWYSLAIAMLLGFFFGVFVTRCFYPYSFSFPFFFNLSFVSFCYPMYLGCCWRAHVVLVQSSTMAWHLHCLLPLQQYDAVSPCHRVVTTKLVSLYCCRIKKQHGHGVCWMSTARKNDLNVKNNVKKTHSRTSVRLD